MTTLTFSLPESLKKKIKKAAHDDGRKAAQFVRRMIETHLPAKPAAAVPARRIKKNEVKP